MTSPADSRLDSLAMTAWWTAAARGSESERSDRLFDDPWATILAGPKAVEAFDLAVHGTGTGDLHAVITRFFDEFLLRATRQAGMEQVVLVAAGLDSRAFRLHWPARTRLFELEQSQVISYKNNRLSFMGAAPRCQRHAIGVDLNEPWTESLLRAGFEPSQRSVWVLEGFLYFLREPVVRDLLKTITDLAAPGSWLGMDVVNREMLNSPWTRHWNERMAAIGAPWLFASDQPEALLQEVGWLATVVQPGEAQADFGRCPYPLTSRDTPEVPQSLLVMAERP